MRRFLALDQSTAHALLAEIDGERQSDRPGADDQDLGIRSHAVIIYAVNGAGPDPGAGRPQDRRRSAWSGDSLIGGPRCIEPLLRWAGRGGDLPFGEASTAAFFALTMTSFGYAYAAGAHVRLDVLSRRFSPRVHAAIELSAFVPDRSAALRSGGARRDRIGMALLSAGGALGGHRVDLQWLLRAWVRPAFCS